MNGHMAPPIRRHPHPDDPLPPMSPRAAAVIEAARNLAWFTHGNTSSRTYGLRAEAFAILRGCLEELDREQMDVAA